MQVDCANGVGAGKFRLLLKHLPASSRSFLTVVNDGSAGKLNHECGADHVKVNQRLPAGIADHPNIRAASVDGDADRLVYFYTDAGSCPPYLLF